MGIHWKSIESAYRSSPYFEFYENDFFIYYNKKYNYLIDVNHDFHKLICNLIGINKTFKKSTEFSFHYNKDFRNAISPKSIKKKKFREYIQVFSDKIGVKHNLSIIDLLFNIGPETLSYLKKGYAI